MRRVLTAALAAATVAAAPIAAAQSPAAADVPRVGDRVGARSETANNFLGFPLYGWLVIGLIGVVAWNTFDEDDDEPVSA